MSEINQSDQVELEDPSEEAVPDQFQVNSDDAANWVIKRIVEARNYCRKCDEWCEREKARAKRTEEFFLYRFQSQLSEWVRIKILEQGGRKKSVNVPAGTAGFRREPSKIIVDDETSVLAWCKLHRPDLITYVEKLSKSGLNEHVETTGELPETGVHIESEKEKFYVR